MYIYKAAVVGAGAMGAEIAQAISFSGLPVLLKDVDQARVEQGLEVIRKIYQRRVDRGKMTQDELEKKLTAAGVRHTFHRYHAQHAFANETAVNSPIPTKYDKGAAETAWQRTLAFFAQHLGAPQHA